MAIKFNPAPLFKSKVSIPNPGGEEPVIEFEFKHKTKTAFSAWSKPGDKSLSHEDSVLEIASDWKESDIGVPFGREGLTELFELFPSAPIAIYSAYSEALLAGKTKN